MGRNIVFHYKFLSIYLCLGYWADLRESHDIWLLPAGPQRCVRFRTLQHCLLLSDPSFTRMVAGIDVELLWVAKRIIDAHFWLPIWHQALCLLTLRNVLSISNAIQILALLIHQIRYNINIYHLWVRTFLSDNRRIYIGQFYFSSFYFLYDSILF